MFAVFASRSCPGFASAIESGIAFILYVYCCCALRGEWSPVFVECEWTVAKMHCQCTSRCTMIPGVGQCPRSPARPRGHVLGEMHSVHYIACYVFADWSIY